MEYCIDGGNHAQYANYGPQSKDGVAGISRTQQQEKTVELICGSCNAVTALKNTYQSNEFEYIGDSAQILI